MEDNQDHFDVLRKINNKPKSSQRELARELGFSLGKLVKIENFKKNPNKLNYFYALTPKGIAAKTKLTINFMKKKMAEYDELKSEADNN